MKRGKFATQIYTCAEVFRDLEMDLEFIPNPSYPDNPRSYFKGMLYHEIWKACIINKYYHFQLFDNSLIYCSYTNENMFSYSYYEFPYAADTYTEFLGKNDLSYRESGEMLREEYDQYLTTCDFKESVCPVRYDICYDQYVKARHPVSHIHIGHNNNIRIRTEKIMGPLSFIYFLIRQYYPESWVEFLKIRDDDKNRKVEIQKVLRNVRFELQEVKKGYLTELDACEIFLS